MFLKKGREAVRLLGLLPCCAAAVALQRVVDHMMVMGIFARQDTCPAGAAKGTCNKLGERKNLQERLGDAVQNDLKKQWQTCMLVFP